MRISDWSSDVCSSDLKAGVRCRSSSKDAMRFGRSREPSAIKVGAGTTRSKTRYGCFLPDLTGLARTSPARLPLRHMGEEHRGRKRSEERRVGKECVRTCRSRWWTYH